MFRSIIYHILHGILFVVGAISIVYGISWALSHKDFQPQYGISFNHEHAAHLGLDWKIVYGDILTDLQPKYIRLAAMWDEVEPQKGEWFFDHVDFMLDAAAANNTKVLLVVGQKAPRWPECHIPQWAEDLSVHDRREQAMTYVSVVAERYKDHPALEYWQVENEPYIPFAFGECAAFDQSVVEAEISLVRQIDPNHRVVMTDSGEMSTWYPAAVAGDLFGTTLYRIVRTPSGSIWTYDWLPAGFYRLKSELFGLSPETFFVAELQAEPWFTGDGPSGTPLESQRETMTPERMAKHIAYADRVGASRVYLWGVEWWYWMRQTHNDSSFWDIARSVLTR